MIKPELNSFLNIEDLPSPPLQVMKALDRLDRTPFKNFEILNVLQNDPSTACRLMKIANTPFYGHMKKIESLKQASELLGPGPVKNIILTTTIMENFEENHVLGGLMDPVSLWRHMAATAAIARDLGHCLPQTDPDVCYTIGLVHDVGKIALLVYWPKILSDFVERSKAGNIPLDQSALESIGWRPPDLSAALAESWGFPQHLVEAIGNFPEAPAEPKKNLLATALYLADTLANLGGYDDGIDSIGYEFPVGLMQSLDLNPNIFEKTRPQLEKLSIP
tara:strand:- start:3751 stop:4581 length:831 start_codon:yes stop_codon:yes gene_type:complete